MSTVINFKTDIKIKTQAQKVASDMGLSLSDILNVYLRNFVRSKKICIDLNENESNPSDVLLEAVEDTRKEYKSGKMRKFKNIDAMTAHLAKL